jgi:hypothetical protein
MKITEEKINSIKENLFYRSRNVINNYNTFNWHKNGNQIDTDCINSSQALAIDFWGCIAMSEYRNEIINLLFGKKKLGWTIDFEFEDKALLAEKKSTQIDILLKSSNIAIFIESKFTETDGGSCSQLNKTKKGLIQCSGNYEEQTNPVNGITNKCSLSGKGIKYWDYIESLTDFKKSENYQPCPIKKGEYQWIRNICLAEAYSKKNDVKAETFLAYLDSKKCPIADKVKNNTYLGKLEGKLSNRDMFRPISYNESLDKIVKYLGKKNEDEKQVFIDLKKWIEDKENKIE